MTTLGTKEVHTMSRKDYRAFADILAGDLATCETDGERRKVACIALSMEDVFKRDNPRFDRQRFREAAGLDPWNPTRFGDDHAG